MSFDQAIFIQQPEISEIDVLSQKGVSLVLNKANRPIVRSIIDKNGKVVELAHKWLRDLSGQIGIAYSEGTVEQYGRNLSYFIRWIESNKPYPNLDIDNTFLILTRADILAWVNSMQLARTGPASINNREAVAKQFMEWLTTHDGGRVRDMKDSPWGNDDETGTISSPPNKKSPKVITSKHIIDLLSNLHNECERCMFHAQYDIGLRIAELVNWKQGDLPNLDLYDYSIEFIPLSIKGVKGRAGNTKDRSTIISRPLLSRIKRYHSSVDYRLAPDWDINDPDKPVFLTVNGLEWQTRNASKQFNRAVERSGLLEGFKTHWMRHGTAFSILSSDAGKDIYDRMLIAQQMLGHAHLTTTEIYTQIAPSLLVNLSQGKEALDRTKEAEDIREQTYLAPLKHKEKRGRK